MFKHVNCPEDIADEFHLLNDDRNIFQNFLHLPVVALASNVFSEIMAVIIDVPPTNTSVVIGNGCQTGMPDSIPGGRHKCTLEKGRPEHILIQKYKAKRAERGMNPLHRQVCNVI